MKLTKFEHACVVLEKDGSSLVIDPGAFTTPLSDVTNVVAIVVTHEHADHWTPDQLRRIVQRNPEARILGPAGFAAAAAEFGVETVAAGDRIGAGPFSLEFFGELHAVIHESVPMVDNVGVLVDGSFYYGGDSYTLPGVAVETLAVPVGAPWLKIGDAMDYVLAVAPRNTLPVHEMVLSQIGKAMTNARIEAVTAQVGGRFHLLEAGESLDL